MAEMPRTNLAWCQTSRGLRGLPTVRLKRNRVDFLFSYWFESSVILTDLLSLDHTGMAMSRRSLRQLGAYGRYGCISELVWQYNPPGDMLVRQFSYTCENEYVIYLFVIFLFLTECVLNVYVYFAFPTSYSLYHFLINRKFIQKYSQNKYFKTSVLMSRWN